jgi:hypothetical protein
MNMTTLGIAAVLALTIMVVAGLVVTPVFAKSSVGDGNTIIKFKNKAKATASGFGTLAANVQQNQINFGSP